MSLRHAVLGLLSDEPGSGYDLLKRFETAMANVWSATQSQLYGELGKLEKDELIQVAAQGPRGRKEYALTDAGRAELRAWLLDPDSGNGPRNAAMLRVYFLGALRPEQARGYLRHLREAAEHRTEHLAKLAAEIDWDEGDQSVFGGLVLEWGRRYSAMQREWAQWAEQQVRSARG